MKIERVNVPLSFRNDVFSDVTKQNTHTVGILKNTQSEDKVVLSNKKKLAIGGITVGLAGGAIWLVNALKGKNKAISLKNSDPIEGIIDIVKSNFKTTIDAFPEDFAYIKNLAKNLGLKEGEEFKLNSVIGKSQLTKLLDEYTPQDFTIGKNLEGAKNMTFRVNLHNHTQFSDGRLSIEEFLEQARKYADRIAQNKPADNKPPFVISITDHDTMDGCKEALKILSDNPEKYKNLKVVLGSEISVSNNDANIVSRPLNFELIGYCQNPYDEKLVKILDNIHTTRQENVEKFLSQIQTEFPDCKFDINEAKSFHANLRTMRTNGVLYLAGDYAKFKLSLNEYIKRINKILPEGKEKISPEKLFTKLGENYYYRMDAFGERNISEYFQNHGLKDYLIENNILTKENEKDIEKIFKIDLKAKEKFINDTVQKDLPTLNDRKNYTIDPKDIFEATTEGFYGFAHPAIIDFSSDNISPARKKLCKENKFAPHENLVYEIFAWLKNIGKEKFCASEVNYQSYPEHVNYKWIDFMKTSIADNPNLKLKYTGGIDAHKPSIFLKHKYIDENTLKEILGETT